MHAYGHKGEVRVGGSDVHLTFSIQEAEKLLKQLPVAIMEAQHYLNGQLDFSDISPITPGDFYGVSPVTPAA